MFNLLSNIEESLIYIVDFGTILLELFGVIVLISTAIKSFLR